MDSSLNRPEETPGNLYRQYKETKRRAYKHISDIRVQLSQETESGEDNLDNNHYQIPDGDTKETADSSRMVIGKMKERMKETTRSEEKKISLQEQRNMKFEAVTSFKETYHSLRYVYSRLYPVLKSYYEYKAKLSDHENPPSLKNLQDMAEGIQKLQKQVQELNSDPVFSAEAREQGLTDFTRGQRQKLEKSINDMKQAKGLLKPGEGSDDSRLSRITAVFRKIQLPKASESKRPLKEMETSLNTIFPPSEDQLVEQAEGLVQDLKRRVLPPLTDTDNPNLGTLASNLETLLQKINRRMSRRKGIWIDYRDHQRNSDIVRNVGTRRPDIANLFIHGKIEIFPDTSITKLIETKEVNRRVHMAIRSDLSIEEATDAIIDVIDDNRYRDLFQGKVEPPMQKTKNLIALYKDAALAHENLSSFIEQFAAQTHGNPMLASLKEREDAFDKILSDYGGDI